jgi:hypothetical protein
MIDMRFFLSAAYQFIPAVWKGSALSEETTQYVLNQYGIIALTIQQ